MDVEIEGHNTTIVKNGKVTVPALFDKVIDNGAIRINSTTLETRFFIYMSFDQGKTNDTVAEYLRTIPTTKIHPPRVDTDQNIMYPVLKGSASAGGEIGSEKRVHLLIDLLIT